MISFDEERNEYKKKVGRQRDAIANLLELSEQHTNLFDLGSYDVLLRISDTFHVSVDYLLGKNVIDAHHLSSYEAELIEASRTADCRAREDALLLLKSHPK